MVLCRCPGWGERVKSRVGGCLCEPVQAFKEIYLSKRNVLLLRGQHPVQAKF